MTKNEVIASLLLEAAELLKEDSLNESIIELGYSGCKLSYKDNDDLKQQLIGIAKKNMFTDKDYKSWSQSYTQERAKSIYKKSKNMQLGYCCSDPGGNYIIYSFKTKSFYELFHEEDLLENITKRKRSIQQVKSYIEEYEK